MSLAALVSFELLLRGIDRMIPHGHGYGVLARWVIGSLIAFLTLLELYLRATGFNHPKINQCDPLVGWRPRAGVQGTYNREGEQGDMELAINSAGYRDSEHTLAKPAGTFRIAILGDSMAEAREVPLEQTFWKRWEKQLSASPLFQGNKVEVLNFSVNGYGTAQEYLTLEEHALKYSPDLVLLAFFTGNDVTENSQMLGRHKDRPYFSVIRGHFPYLQAQRCS